MIFSPTTPPIGDQPLELKAPRRSAMGSVIGHTGFNVVRYHITHVFGGLFPLLAGSLLFGWRALVSVVIVVGSTLLAGLIWRRIGVRGHPLRPSQMLWIGMVLALMLPANLLRGGRPASWPLLPAAGVLLVMLCWALGGVGSGRFHPAVVVYLLLASIYSPLFAPQTVLQHNHLMTGDLLAAPPQSEARAGQLAWLRRPIDPGIDAIHIVPPSQSLLAFTHPTDRSASENLSVDTMLRDRVPPLEDVVLGAVPGGIGVTSAVAVIVGGLFLLYRGLIDFRIPLLITASAWCTLLVLPIQIESHWRWVPSHVAGFGWEAGVTLVNYEALASPLLFTAFFLAGSPTVRPLTRRGRTIYAVLIGLLAAVFQMYGSVALGSYWALLIVGALT